MSNPDLPQSLGRDQAIPLENCCVDQIVCSMFEEVADDEIQHLGSRSDKKEIVRFSESLIEQELLFGSAPDEAIQKARQRISSKS